MTLQELWEAALGEIEVSISKASFNTWFKNSQLISRQGHKVVVGISSIFQKSWIETKFNDIVIRALRNVDSTIKEVVYEVYPSEALTKKPEKTFLATKQTNPVSLPQKRQLEFKSLNKNQFESGLNPKYSFESLIVGSFNEVAHAAALSVTENLGKKFNPLFIHGLTGLGKTHLLQAIGNRVLQLYKNVKIKYVTSETFTNELVNALKRQEMEQFKQRYRSVDLLIIDDVQFLSNKEKSQDELFHTFNYLYERNKQIVLSSDRPPKIISQLEGRLRSRFEGGVIVDLGTPDYETRLAILKKKAEEKDVVLPDWLLQEIAKKISKNIRVLEGALNRIAIEWEQFKGISKQRASQLIADFSSAQQREITFDKVVQTVAQILDLDVNDILRKGRKKEVARARQIIMYLLRTELDYSFPTIGQKLGGRDHTTVMYAYRKIDEDIKNNQETKQEIELIKERIYNYS
jgi:chromosomal replication initiator protein